MIRRIMYLCVFISFRTLYFEYMKGYGTGADPRFLVRGGALKKIAPSEGRGISCEKSRFYAKKIIYFFQF